VELHACRVHIGPVGGDPGGYRLTEPLGHRLDDELRNGRGDEVAPDAVRVRGRQAERDRELLLVDRAVAEQLDGRKAANQRLVQVVRQQVVHHRVGKWRTVDLGAADRRRDVGPGFGLRQDPRELCLEVLELHVALQHGPELRFAARDARERVVHHAQLIEDLVALLADARDLLGRRSRSRTFGRRRGQKGERAPGLKDA
jgi:hypothetical protein